MRGKAEDKGTLKTSSETGGENRSSQVAAGGGGGKEVIVIEQANPQTVYVPSYDPEVVYGPPAYPYYPYTYPGYYPGMGLAWGTGIMIGAGIVNNWWGDCDWNGGDININNNNNFNRNNINNVNRRQGAVTGSIVPNIVAMLPTEIEAQLINSVAAVPAAAGWSIGGVGGVGGPGRHRRSTAAVRWSSAALGDPAVSVARRAGGVGGVGRPGGVGKPGRCGRCRQAGRRRQSWRRGGVGKPGGAGSRPAGGTRRCPAPAADQRQARHAAVWRWQ